MLTELTRSTWYGVLISAVNLAGCHPINTVPDTALPKDPIREFKLELPPNLEVRHIDFSATQYATDENGIYGGQTGGRAFIKVYAVDRVTGESVLLLYENIGKRKQPLQMIRIGGSSSGGDQREPL
jgi:hypothetical protein